jgi:predicted dienelactone hydrolase
MIGTSGGGLTSAGGGGALNTVPSGLYEPTVRYQVAELDGYVVNDAPHNRLVPVLVRYPVGAPGRCPLVLWSHGGQKKDDGKNQNDDWGNALASAGYIVVHMSHTPRNDAEKAALAAEWNLSVQMVNNEIESNIDRPRDAIATLNALADIEAHFAQLKGKIDYERIGLGGHSRGAYTVRTTSCARINLPGKPDYSFLAPAPTNTPLTVRIKAALANSPAGPGRFGFTTTSYRECTLPDLTQTGDGDLTEEQPSDRIAGYALMPPGDKYKMYIADPATPHETFNLNNPQRPDFEASVRSTGLAFMDAYLKGSAAAKAYLTSGNLERESNGKAVISAR